MADFGLAESVGSKDYFRLDKEADVKLPLRWMAIESIEDYIFSEKSDVVSCYNDKEGYCSVLHCYLNSKQKLKI